VPIERRIVETNGIRLHVTEAGSGPLAILLHGFPEMGYSFRHQIPALARRFHVVMPDLRGCGESDKPASGYDVGTLAEDIRALIAALGEKEAFVAGHDWGGVVAWRLAAAHPESVRRLTVLNCPHPIRFMKVLSRSPGQVLRSSYMFFFQIPRLPEAVLRARKAWLLETLFSGSRSHPLTPDELDVYRRTWLMEGTLEGGLQYYRTMARSIFARRPSDSSRARVQVPTLLIWGERDLALGPSLHEKTETYVDAPFEKLLIPHAGHFVHQDAPDEVNEALLRFFSA